MLPDGPHGNHAPPIIAHERNTLAALVWGEAGLAWLVQHRENSWRPGPERELLVGNVALFKLFEKTFLAAALVGVLSYLAERLAHEDVPRGIAKPSGDPCGSENSLLPVPRRTPCIFHLPGPPVSCIFKNFFIFILAVACHAIEERGKSH